MDESSVVVKLPKGAGAAVIAIVIAMATTAVML